MCFNPEILIMFQSLAEMGYELVSGGTENHLVLVNLKNKVMENCFEFSYRLH